jgi:pimeloyl-ACP methyl ester carboxylesterase
MKYSTLFCIVGLSSLAGACAPSPHPARAPAAPVCAQAMLQIDGNQIWVDQQGAGPVTVAFEAGFGNESSVWADITPKIRAAGARTFVYDRAGMGKSTIDTSAPYSIDNDVHILRTALTSCGVTGPIVFVGHSYGGGLGVVAASQDDRIRGLVLVDALIAGTFGHGELEKNLTAMRVQYDEIRAQAPALAKVAIPWAEALPATVQRLDGVRVPPGLPIIDIVAEHGQSTPEATQVWRDAHVAFTAGQPAREYVLATGSSHKVMKDQPALVVASIVKMIGKVQAR